MFNWRSVLGDSDVSLSQLKPVGSESEEVDAEDVKAMIPLLWVIRNNSNEGHPPESLLNPLDTLRGPDIRQNDLNLQSEYGTYSLKGGGAV